MKSKTSHRPAIRIPSVEEDRAVVAAAKADPDAKPLTSQQLKEMVLLKYVARHSRSVTR